MSACRTRLRPYQLTNPQHYCESKNKIFSLILDLILVCWDRALPLTTIYKLADESIRQGHIREGHMSMEKIPRSGNDGEDVPQNLIRKNNMDVPTDESGDVDWRSYVAKYNVPLEFPFEIGETVWILKPSFRAPLGPYKINRALTDLKFELKEESSDVIYAEEVEARFLRRDPDAMS